MPIYTNDGVTSSLSYAHRPFGGAWTTEKIDFVKTFLQISENHHFDLEVDYGGPWYLKRTEDTVVASNVPYEPGNPFQTFYGDVTIGYPSGSFPPSNISAMSDSEMDTIGTKAINSLDPTNPAFDAATFLGEAREGMPSIIGSDLRQRTHHARSAGGEYLNVEFGWKPLLSDLKKLGKAVLDSHKITSDYSKGSDKKIFVSQYQPERYDVRSYDGGFVPIPTDFPYFIPGLGIELNTQRTWFKGALRYHLPVPEGVAGNLGYYSAQANKLFGIGLTPETLWNLAPWSWAADWFGDTGDIIANISSSGNDGLVWHYAYVMNHVSRETWYSGQGVARHMLTEYKQRRPATPYGFGVDMSSLSARQIAILAALGLSKAG